VERSGPPDESKVRSAQGAAAFWEAKGRYELTTGFSFRVQPTEDLAAFGPIHDAAQKNGRVMAERQLPAVLVAGIEPVAGRLKEIISFGRASEEAGEPGSPAEIVVAAAAKFAAARREAIGRVAKGPKNRGLRHAFGISRVMRVISVDEVRNACVALLVGRDSHPGTSAARLITAADVRKAKAFVVQLEDVKSRSGARRSSEAELARERDVLHAAVELFYDRFAAAVCLAFEDDDAARVALLSLVPRRKERRTAAAAPTAISARAAGE
jgi:hypothetical protein